VLLVPQLCKASSHATWSTSSRAVAHASSRITSITLHLRFCAGLRVVGLKKEHVLR
jgi:hypothetical protein